MEIKTLKDLKKELKELFNTGIPYIKGSWENQIISLTNCLDFSPEEEINKDIVIVKYPDNHHIERYAGGYQLCFKEFFDDGTYLGEEEAISPIFKDPQRIYNIIKEYKDCE